MQRSAKFWSFNWMKAVCLVLAIIAYPVRSETIEQTNPYLLFDKVAQQAFVRFKQEWPKVKQDPDYLKTIIKEELMPYVDHEYAAFKVLGKYARSIKAEKRREFVDVFEGYVVSVYANLFAQYRETQTVQVDTSPAMPDGRIAVVRAKIVEPARPDIDLIFKLIKRNDRWRAFDMEAEGISVLNNKRKEIASAYRSLGIDGIIKDLKMKAERSITLKDNEG
ncbi:MlaC/ttg2D family ABC transporter substrate-binding protein [Gayadomonas joobiniege]|uniref:MlaC/ttg2D family ABC transporter substrate-binding protein n=1 Tax=Gayadomonas joobiniege TaxID=1234606 RepID=UPI0012DFC5E1|nr:ABC transporter substrate-binding protein [Gayadomonas joobiniege]